MSENFENIILQAFSPVYSWALTLLGLTLHIYAMFFSCIRTTNLKVNVTRKNVKNSKNVLFEQLQLKCYCFASRYGTISFSRHTHKL